MLKPVSILYVFLLLCACTEREERSLSIVFSADSTSVIINHVNVAGLLELQREKAVDSVVNSLVTVVETPAGIDTTFREQALPGRVIVTDSNVVFVPDRPFIRGTGYLVITHLNAKFGNLKQVMTGGLSLGVKPTQQLLIR